jgi:hypothetical protein
MGTAVTATPAITIRRTRRDDVPAIIAMLADDRFTLFRIMPPT